MTNRRLFRRSLLRWYSKQGRELPWRRTRDPYAILVSEFMLQQTQVATVLPFYRKWLQRFPNFRALSRASEQEVLHAWQGLGYYRRARDLHQTAMLVTNRHRGCLPRSIEILRSLPGIGKYTAHALVTFAFDQSVPIVETNTARVLSRLFSLHMPIDATDGRAKLWNWAAALVPKKSPSIYNSALLDLGALVCLSRNPRCGICPVNKFCRSKNPETLPIKRARPRTKRIVERHAFIIRNDKLLLTKASNRWRGMWILPQLNRVPKRNAAIYKAAFPFTHHQVTLRIFRGSDRKVNNQQERWFSKRELAAIPIPSPHLRAIEQLIANA